jgi:hypothetical protein
VPGLSLDIHEGEIKNAIAVAIAESFAPERRESLIRDVVRAHLAHKEHSYDKETILSRAVGKLVRELAIAELERQLEASRTEIEAAVSGMLGERFAEGVVDKVEEALKRVAAANIHVSATFDETP